MNGAEFLFAMTDKIIIFIKRLRYKGQKMNIKKETSRKKKALVLLAPGFEEIEAVTIVDILRRGEIEVTTAGLKKDLIVGSHNISIKADVYYKDVREEEFDILILPGGQPGSTNLKKDVLVLNWIKKRFSAGHALAAICAAPTVFQEAGIARGLKITSYPGEKPVFSESLYKTDSVVKDKNVISSRGVGTAIEFALALVAELNSPKIAAEIKAKILYPPMAQ